jgi:uncharacterized membrane protein YfcA
MNKQEETKNISKNKMKGVIFQLLGGSFAGLCNSLFGGGGGMIIVPLLSLLLKCETKKAHATAILIILPLSIVSGLFYLAFSVFNASIGIPVGFGVILGGILGALLLSKLSSNWLTIIFSVIMVIAGVKMLLF